MPSSTRSSAAPERRRNSRVYLRPPKRSDEAEFVAAVRASRKLHAPWVQPPSTRARYAAFVRRHGRFKAANALAATQVGMLVCRREDDAIVGVIVLSEIVHGFFQSAYLGYYAFAPYARAGYMSEGLDLMLALAFRTLKLHRVEANIQPTNAPSLRLARRAGFSREGYSPRYVRVGRRWRDHVRMAVLSEDWRARRAARRR